MTEKREYEMPQVITYTEAEILEELGEAQAYGGPCGEGHYQHGGPGQHCK